MIRKLMKPWLIVLIGAGMTVASAILAHYQVSKNMMVIEDLEKQMSQINQTISDQWQNMGRFERDGNEALMLATLAEGDAMAPANPAVINNMTIYVRHFVGKSDVPAQRVRVERALDNREMASKGSVFREILTLVDAQRTFVIDKVDNLYIEKVALQEHVQTIMKSNASLANTALVLQMLGLICVLSKDLARREWPK